MTGEPRASMHPVLIVTCALAAALAGCTRGSAPVAPAVPLRETPVPSASTPVPVPAAPTDAASPAIPASTLVKLALSGEGVDFVSENGSVRHLVFGAPAADAIDTVSRAQGAAPQRGRNEECGAGPLDMATWPGGLTVMSQDGRFIGWSVSRGAADGGNAGMATMAGIGVGSTRGELEAAYAADIRETTLGQEFAAGDVFGVLDGTGPSARITALWAGTSCNFR